MSFSDRQKEVLRTAFVDAGRFVLVPGPIRSGKTWAAVASFISYTLQYEDTQFGLAAPGQKQIQNVLLHTAEELGMPLRPSHDYYTIPSAGKPNRIVTFPIERAESNKRISGHTFQGALIDEAVDCNETAVNVLIERCSMPSARIWMITNPKQPSHWYRENFIVPVEEGRVPGVHIPFSIDDNPVLEDSYKDSLRELYKGVELQRRYYGKWVLGSGAIYPTIEKAFLPKLPHGDPYRFDISVDHASASITHALLIAYYPDSYDQAIVVDEWRNDGRETTLTWNEQIAGILKHFRPWVRKVGIFRWIADIAPAGFQVALSKYLKRPEFGNRGGNVHGAYKIAVKEGIDLVELWQQEEKFFIGPGCHYLRSELANYEWDKRAAERGDDKPVKANDHGPDALRYYITTTEYLDRMQSSLPKHIILEE